MNPAERKKALRLLTYGLYVATAPGREGYAAGTITWFSQSSFQPPLVVAGIKKTSSLHRAIETSRVFAVHVVGKGQRAMAMRFFRDATPAGDTLSGYRFRPGATGAPILEDAAAWLECRVLGQLAQGDHTVFLAEVVGAGVRRDEEPLTLREAGFAYGG